MGRIRKNDEIHERKAHFEYFVWVFFSFGRTSANENSLTIENSDCRGHQRTHIQLVQVLIGWLKKFVVREQDVLTNHRPLAQLNLSRLPVQGDPQRTGSTHLQSSVYVQCLKHQTYLVTSQPTNSNSTPCKGTFCSSHPPWVVERKMPKVTSWSEKIDALSCLLEFKPKQVYSFWPLVVCLEVHWALKNSARMKSGTAVPF